MGDDDQNQRRLRVQRPCGRQRLEEPGIALHLRRRVPHHLPLVRHWCGWGHGPHVPREICPTQWGPSAARVRCNLASCSHRHGDLQAAHLHGTRHPDRHHLSDLRYLPRSNLCTAGANSVQLTCPSAQVARLSSIGNNSRVSPERFFLLSQGTSWLVTALALYSLAVGMLPRILMRGRGEGGGCCRNVPTCMDLSTA